MIATVILHHHRLHHQALKNKNNNNIANWKPTCVSVKIPLILIASFYQAE